MKPWLGQKPWSDSMHMRSVFRDGNSGGGSVTVAGLTSNVKQIRVFMCIMLTRMFCVL